MLDIADPDDYPFFESNAVPPLNVQRPTSSTSVVARAKDKARSVALILGYTRRVQSRVHNKLVVPSDVVGMVDGYCVMGRIHWISRSDHRVFAMVNILQRKCLCRKIKFS